MTAGFCWCRWSTQIVHRKLGHITALRKAPLDQARQFYILAKSMQCDEIKALCERTIMATKTSGTTWAEDGKFLPLNVWARDGWDAKAIEENSLPEDIKKSEKYGWLTYRVPIESSGRKEDNLVSDSIGFKSKKKTKCLKRRRTDESEACSPAGSSQDFSDEESGDSAEQAAKKKTKAKSKPKAKAKAPASKPTKEQKEAKAKAKKLKTKIEGYLKKLRGLCCNPHFLEADDDIVQPVKELTQKVKTLQGKLAKVAESGVDDSGVIEEAELLNPNNPDAKKQVQALNKALARLARMS